MGKNLVLVAAMFIFVGISYGQANAINYNKRDYIGMGGYGDSYYVYTATGETAGKCAEDAKEMGVIAKNRIYDYTKKGIPIKTVEYEYNKNGKINGILITSSNNRKTWNKPMVDIPGGTKTFNPSTVPLPQSVQSLNEELKKQALPSRDSKTVTIFYSKGVGKDNAGSFATIIEHDPNKYNKIEVSGKAKRELERRAAQGLNEQGLKETRVIKRSNNEYYRYNQPAKYAAATAESNNYESYIPPHNEYVSYDTGAGRIEKKFSVTHIPCEPSILSVNWLPSKMIDHNTISYDAYRGRMEKQSYTALFSFDSDPLNSKKIPYELWRPSKDFSAAELLHRQRKNQNNK